MKTLLFITLIFNLSIFADYSNHKDSEKVIDELVTKHGFERAYVLEVLKDAKKRKTALSSVARPAEKTKSWDDYIAIFIKKKRIIDGKRFIKINIDTLERAEKEVFANPKISFNENTKLSDMTMHDVVTLFNSLQIYNNDMLAEAAVLQRSAARSPRLEARVRMQEVVALARHRAAWG